MAGGGGSCHPVLSVGIFKEIVDRLLVLPEATDEFEHRLVRDLRTWSSLISEGGCSTRASGLHHGRVVFDGPVRGFGRLGQLSYTFGG
jgi:hypothetical protein